MKKEKKNNYRPAYTTCDKTIGKRNISIFRKGLQLLIYNPINTYKIKRHTKINCGLIQGKKTLKINDEGSEANAFDSLESEGP